MKWITNTEGKRDAVLTMAFIAFVIVAIKVLLAGASVTIGAHTVSTGAIDAGVIAALLTPTLGAYVARRYTDRQPPAPPPGGP